MYLHVSIGICSYLLLQTIYLLAFKKTVHGCSRFGIGMYMHVYACICMYISVYTGTCRYTLVYAGIASICRYRRMSRYCMYMPVLHV